MVSTDSFSVHSLQKVRIDHSPSFLFCHFLAFPFFEFLALYDVLGYSVCTFENALQAEKKQRKDTVTRTAVTESLGRSGQEDTTWQKTPHAYTQANIVTSHHNKNRSRETLWDSSPTCRVSRKGKKRLISSRGNLCAMCLFPFMFKSRLPTPPSQTSLKIYLAWMQKTMTKGKASSFSINSAVTAFFLLWRRRPLLVTIFLFRKSTTKRKKTLESTQEKIRRRDRQSEQSCATRSQHSPKKAKQ